MRHLQKVEEFSHKFGLPVRQHQGFTNCENAFLRIKRLREEVQEITEAILNNDMEEILDGLVDLEYILHGTTLAYGLQHVYDEAFDRVHEANMKKQRATSASQSKHNTRYDIIKPEGWEPPVLSDLIQGDLT